MLNPYAIWLIPSNMDTILGEFPITEAMLLDLDQDSINEKTDYWLATHPDWADLLDRILC